MRKTIVGIVCMLITTGAYAEFPLWKVFVGGNVGYTGALWNSDTKDYVDTMIHTNLATSFVGGGLEFGAKYARDVVYNYGASLSYDYMLDSKGDLKSDTYARVNVGFSSIGVTFDNYIRLFKQSYTENMRGDLVLGVGVARVTERVDVVPTPLGEINGTERSTDEDFGTAFLFKVGYNGQLNQNWDWYANCRWFVNSASDKDFDSLLNFSVGVKYNF